MEEIIFMTKEMETYITCKDVEKKFECTFDQSCFELKFLKRLVEPVNVWPILEEEKDAQNLSP